MRFLSHFPNVNESVTDAVLPEIRRERGVELILEGFRFYILVRCGLGPLPLKPYIGWYGWF